eukprot:EST49383.1 Hypothetical protein SS50377_10308 [Spironucleus salmonicida]
MSFTSSESSSPFSSKKDYSTIENDLSSLSKKVSSINSSFLTDSTLPLNVSITQSSRTQPEKYQYKQMQQEMRNKFQNQGQLSNSEQIQHFAVPQYYQQKYATPQSIASQQQNEHNYQRQQPQQQLRQQQTQPPNQFSQQQYTPEFERIRILMNQLRKANQQGLIEAGIFNVQYKELKQLYYEALQDVIGQQ